MEDNEAFSTTTRGDDRTGEPTKKGPFTMPSISEIKRVSVVSSAPILFKKRAAADTEEGVATTASEPQILKTSINSPTISTIPANTFTNQDRDVISSTGRKRPREVDSHRDIPSISLAADGDDVRGIPHRLPLKMLARSESSGSSSESQVSSSSLTVVGHSHHPHAIIANPVQKKNPVMKHVRNVPWELGDIVPDFVLGKTTCAMFLSVRYHSLHPNYIHDRLKDLGKQYQLRILLVLVDMKESQKVLQELAKIALLADLTLMLAWSYEEAGRYLETYKAFENKPPDILMERIDNNFFSRATECLTTVKKVNKTDAATLLGNFKSMEKVITASKEDLVLCPGLGPQKAQRLFSLFHQPFKTNTRKLE